MQENKKLCAKESDTRNDQGREDSKIPGWQIVYLLLYFIKENNYLRGVAWLSDVEKPSNEGGGDREQKKGRRKAADCIQIIEKSSKREKTQQKFCKFSYLS